MTITIDYDQGNFIVKNAAARINSAMSILTPQYRLMYLADKSQAEYERITAATKVEMDMLKKLIAEVCTYCDYKLDGTDTDGTKWYRCKVHDEVEPSKDAPCAGYVEEPYIYKTHPLEEA